MVGRRDGEAAAPSSGRAKAAYLGQLRLSLRDALDGYPIVTLEQVDDLLPGYFAEPTPSRVTLSKILQTMGWRKIRVGAALAFASPKPTRATGTVN